MSKKRGRRPPPPRPTLLGVEAARHGGRVQDNSAGRYRDYECVAPPGKVWGCEGVHVLVVSWVKGDLDGQEEAVRDAINRMGLGVRDCDVPDCDDCGE